MNEVFIKVLNMSIAASWLILAVMLLRFALKKAPKWIAAALWGIVALRLAIPFSFESAWSLIPSAATFSPHNLQYETPAIRSGIPAVNSAVNPVLGETFAPNPGGSVNPLYVGTAVVSVIWLIGIAGMLLYAVISYVRVRRRVAERIPYGGNVFLCDHVKSPFILGLVRPKIYLPSGLEAAAVEPVIAHERAHLARRDHWWKPLGFLILAVHWFNPLCWIAYALLCRDIELACDERVIRQMDLDGKKRYSTALLACSTGRRLVTICPLAFGEVGVKERVKNVLHYKKPAFWVIVAAVIACAVVTVCFATNPKQDIPEAQHTGQAQMTAAENPSALVTPVEGAGELSSSYTVTEDMTKDPEYINRIRAMLGLDGISAGSTGDADTPSTDELREKYPEYFELGTFKGLEVYVWQMAESDYRFGLMQGTNREKTLEEKMALKGATAEEMALILSTFDIEDKDIFVIPWQNPISSYMVTEDMVENPEYINNIRSMLGLDGISAGSTGDADTPSTVEADVPAAAFADGQTAIRQAILEHNQSSAPQAYDVACASFVELACLVEDGSDFSAYTFYGWARYEEYQVSESGLDTVGGSHVPVAISFLEDENGFTLTEYWQPRDGSYYAQDIREKFPSYIAGDDMDGQKFLLGQSQECYAQAVASTGLDPNQVIGALVETICSSPALSSNPEDYINENFAAYRELTYYGWYTLQYCFDRFEKGGETGLEGQIMARACEEIADGWGEEPLVFSVPPTGQQWYDAFKNNARNLMEQYTETELAARNPASYLLLSMLGAL